MNHEGLYSLNPEEEASYSNIIKELHDEDCANTTHSRQKTRYSEMNVFTPEEDGPCTELETFFFRKAELTSLELQDSLNNSFISRFFPVSLPLMWPELNESG